MIKCLDIDYIRKNDPLFIDLVNEYLQLCNKNSISVNPSVVLTYRYYFNIYIGSETRSFPHKVLDNFYDYNVVQFNIAATLSKCPIEYFLKLLPKHLKEEVGVFEDYFISTPKIANEIYHFFRENKLLI